MRARQQLNQTANVRAANDLRALQQKKVAMGIQEVERKKQRADEINKSVALQMAEDPSLDRDLISYQTKLKYGDMEGAKADLDRTVKTYKVLKDTIGPKNAFEFFKNKTGAKGDYVETVGDVDVHEIAGNLVGIDSKTGQNVWVRPSGKKPKAVTDIGKLNRALDNGNINQKEYDRAVNKLYKAEGGDKNQSYNLSYRNDETGSTDTIKGVVPGSDLETKLLAVKVPNKDGKMVTKWTRGTKTTGIKPSEKERAAERLREATPTLKTLAKANPNQFLEEGGGFRQLPNGDVFISPATGLPKKLKDPQDALGKRTNVKIIQKVGEQWDDAVEALELLKDPEVKAKLQAVKDAGYWDQAKGAFVNKIWKKLAGMGVTPDSKTGELISRIAKFTSEERKEYMGTAVTQIEEIQSRPWIPNPGESFDSIMVKMGLMAREGEQAFRRWLTTWHDVADMSAYYDGFGLKRFKQTPNGEWVEVFQPPERGTMLGGKVKKPPVITELSDEELLNLLNQGQAK